MAIISANLQFNRGGHGLLDYSSLQKNYSAALLWAQDVNSNAAVGQFIYLEEAETIEEVTYAKGPYVVDAIGEGAVLTPLSKSVAGEQDLSGAISDLQGEVGTLKTGLSKTDSSVNALETKVNALPSTFVTDVKDASGDSVVVDGVVTLGDYATKAELEDAIGDIDFSTLATKEEVSTGLATKANASTTYTKDEVDAAIEDVINQIPDAPFQSVAADDKVLTLNEGVLSSTLSYARENVEGVDSLVLKGVDGAVIGSVPVADFIADGMLESVAPKEEGSNIFVFTFNSAAGSKTFEVDFSKYVDTYRADGETIELGADNTFNVKAGVFETAGAANAVKSEIETELANYAKSADVYSKTDADSTFVKSEGYVAYSDDEKTKLEGIAEGAQVNVIEGVKVNGTDLEISDKKVNIDLSAYALSATVDSSLAKKVDVVEGKGLSSNDFTNDLKAKLDGIAEGAEVNYVKSVGANLAVDGAGNLTVDLSALATSEALTEGLAAKLDASAKVNGVSFVDGEATLDAADIKLNAVIGKKEVDGSQVDRYTTDNDIQYVLNDIDTRIDAINTTIDNVTGGGVIADITAGDGINVDKTTKTNPTVSVKVDELSVKIDSNAKVALKVSEAENQALEVKDDGVYVKDMRSYWDNI